MLLDELAEEGRCRETNECLVESTSVGEVQPLGHLLDAQVGVGQQPSGLLRHSLVNSNSLPMLFSTGGST